MIQRLRQALSQRQKQSIVDNSGKYEMSAVLLPLYYKNGDYCILLTKRTEKVRVHKGQISFPGGMRDTDDNDLRETAIRETWEEMGIKERDITILGQTDNFLTNTNFMVTPYVAHFPYPYPFIVNEDEIANVLEIPLRHLINPEIFRIEKWKRNGVLWDVHFYDFYGENIWGVTGFLLSNFLSIVFGLPRMNNSPVG